MNRLQHFLRAKTQFNLHSPFVFRLYTEVLFSRAPHHGSRRYDDVVWRLSHYYGLPHPTLYSPSITLSSKDGDFFVVDHPHRNESQWQAFVDDSRWQVTIDLFDSGIAIANPHLSKQHFILR